jgi:hypothetical protein
MRGAGRLYDTADFVPGCRELGRTQSAVAIRIWLLLISINMRSSSPNYWAVVIGWVARGLLIAAGFVASWFVTRDVP